MQIKRTISRNQCSDIDDFINHLQISDHHVNSSLIQSHLNNSKLQAYFTNLHKYITGRNLHHLKAYEPLIDGLYILLKGEIKFMFDEANPEKSKMKKSKSSKSSLYNGGALINHQWAVFECTYKNCTAITESYLLRITDEQATLSRFFQHFTIRNQLYANRYLSQDHHKLYDIPTTEKPFYANLNIHTHFSFRKYSFRQVLSFQYPSIILSGSAKLKISHISTTEFEKYGVLLPNLKYEVLSSEICLMIIQNNETLSYNFQLQFNKIIKPQQKSYISSLYKTELCTPIYSESLQRQRQIQRKDKEKSKIFKESEQYSIISSFLCEKNLNFAKKHNLIHHTKQKKQNRCKSPLILFDIANKNSKISTPKFQSIHFINGKEQSSKYFSAHKVSSQSESSHSSLLNRIKLSPASYPELIHKDQKMSLRKINQREIKNIRRVVYLTLDKLQSQNSCKNINQFSSPKLI